MEHADQHIEQPEVAPWALPVGIALAFVGSALLAVSAQPDPPSSLRLPAALAVGWSLFELAGGASLMKHHAIGTSHLVAGALQLVLAGFLAGLGLITGAPILPEAMALVLGVSCLCVGVFRALDVSILRPGGEVTESLSATAFLVIGVVALSGWREVTPVVIDRLVGAVVLLGGLTLAGTANSVRQERQPSHGAARVAGAAAPGAPLNWGD